MTETSALNRGAIHEFDSSVISLTMGFIRLWRADTVYLSTMMALNLLNCKEATSDGQNLEAVSILCKLSKEKNDGFSYIYTVNQLVYATTLLDSFLSDITMFLFLLHPHSIGDQQSISFGDLLSATSRVELINAAATKRVREISFLPFSGRLEFLRERFGLHISLGTETIELLNHFSTVRNVLVHDQSVFDVFLDEDGKIRVKQVKCPRHPTTISTGDPEKAQQAFCEVAAAIYEAVCMQVLKRHGDPFVEKVLGFFRKSISETDSSQQVV